MFNIRNEIFTDRLILRRFCAEDLNDFYEYAKVDGVGERAGWKHHENIEESKTILVKFLFAPYIFAVCLKENGKVVGSIGLHKPEHIPFGKENLRAKELGYTLSKTYWGNGYMTEAAKAFIDYAFNTLDLEMLLCAHFDFNKESRRVIEKCGFVFFYHGTRRAEQLNKNFLCKEYYLIRKQGDETSKGAKYNI